MTEPDQSYEGTFAADDDRLSELFDVARSTRPTDHLPEHEREEVAHLRSLLDIIDTAWSAPPSELDRIRALFLQKLGAREPDHPWLKDSTVETLGDLVRAGADDVPILPPGSFELLAQDSTPLSRLFDRDRRSAVVGQSLKNAAVPQQAIARVVLWINRLLTAVSPVPTNTQPRLIFTRKQKGPPRGD